MRIALTIPPVEGMPAVRPPLNFGYSAACLKEAGHEVIIRDYGLTPHMPVDEAAAAVCREEPDIVGISVATYRLTECLEMARVVKETSDAVVGLAGPHPTARPVETLAHDGVDIVIVGEAEETAVELAGRLAGGRPVEGVAGIAYKVDDEIRRNQPRPLVKDINQLPFPDRDALQIEDYPLKLHSGEPMTNMISSRGTTRKRVAYLPDISGLKYRPRSPKSVVAEIQCIVENYGFRAISIDDYGFTLDQQRLRRILELIESRDLAARWECTAQVDVLGEEDYARMAHAGCAAVRFDNLTSNTVAMERMGYGITLAQVRDAVQWCKELGIRTKGHFLTGLPGETRDDIERTASFAVELELDEAVFSIVVPMPGTALWDTAMQVHPELDRSRQYPTAVHVRPGPGQHVFANLSDLADGDLVEATCAAYDLFWKRVVRRRQYNDRFGDFGDLVWRLSLLTKFKPVRSLKRTLTHRRPRS